MKLNSRFNLLKGDLLNDLGITKGKLQIDKTDEAQSISSEKNNQSNIEEEEESTMDMSSSKLLDMLEEFYNNETTNTDIEKEKSKSNEDIVTSEENKTIETNPIININNYEKFPTEQEDIDEIYDAMTKAEEPIASTIGGSTITNWEYSDELFYDNISRMLESENEVVKQFAQMFKDAIEQLQLTNRNEAGAFIEKVFTNTGKFTIAQLSENPQKALLSELDKNNDGSFFDELAERINTEASKIKVISPEEVENATTIDMENLFLEDKSKSYFPTTIKEFTNNSIEPEYIVENISNMLLSNDPGARKLGNILQNTFNKYLCGADTEKKIRLTEKILSIMNEKAYDKEYNGFSLDALLRNETLDLLDKNSDGDLFDAINEIVSGEELKTRYESLSDEFWDMESFFKHANTSLATTSEEHNQTRTTLTNQELLELSKKDDSGVYGSLRRNFEEIDTNNDGILSYDEIEPIVGSGFKTNFRASDGFEANMYKIEEPKFEKYANSSIEERLEIVIEEAIKYCEERGLDDHLAILKSKKWSIVAEEPVEGAAGDCNWKKHKIRISPTSTLNANSLFGDMYYAVSVLMHELTHACYPEQKKNSIQQENDCDQIAEDYLDSVGRGKYDNKDETYKINKENSESDMYSDLQHDNYSGRNRVWAEIKDWYD